MLFLKNLHGGSGKQGKNDIYFRVIEHKKTSLGLGMGIGEINVKEASPFEGLF